LNLTVLSETRKCVVIRLEGDVQGSGIRPAIANLATQLGLRGTVRNSRQGVEIQLSSFAPGQNATCAERKASLIPEFAQTLLERFPHTKQTIEYLDIAEIPQGFEILDSKADGNAQFVVPLDRVICDACLNECRTACDRRFGYALNSCAQCGPRYSMIVAMPYDRAATSMSLFPMCRECRSEYADPTHRRFHAQTNCCPQCGPQVCFESSAAVHQDGVDALTTAAQAIKSGQIIAMKGLGGYQLVCDATNDDAVALLRKRKGRSAKPLAVMVGSLDEARAIAVFDTLEEAALDSPAGPIVIVQSKPYSQLSPLIHPGLTQIGIMLPTTAMHALLLDQAACPLVVTSGNREGEPLEYEEEDARSRLAELVDGFLHHNRPIQRPIDDSVVRCMAGRQVTLRAARGLAPLPFDCEADCKLTALGGQQKSAIALSNSHGAVLGPHVGDLTSLLTRERYLDQRAALEDLMEGEPEITAHDQHPDYFSSLHAFEQSNENSESVQHHHAHVISGMLEHGWLDREVLGFAFDGTGWGSDGTIWGGEVLVSQADKFERVAHLLPFPLIGGERAVMQAWRVGAWLLHDALGSGWACNLGFQRLCQQWGSEVSQIKTLLRLADTPSISLRTTSMGRLFDGVAAIVCGFACSTYEGEAAMRLEAICDPDSEGSYALGWLDEVPIQFDWRPVVRDIVQDILSGFDTSCIAMKFHRCIAYGIAELAERFPHLPVVLTGGVFQNRILVELVSDRLASHPVPVGLPGRIPPNDGGLAVGQLLVAAHRIARRTACV
jgi:hydrogenase maturation protein HypF